MLVQVSNEEATPLRKDVASSLPTCTGINWRNNSSMLVGGPYLTRVSSCTRICDFGGQERLLKKEYTLMGEKGHVLSRHGKVKRHGRGILREVLSFEKIRGF